MANILVIEDEYPISQVLKVYLQKVGYSVTQCFNGGQALVMFRETQPDLVLLDIMLPEKWLVHFKRNKRTKYLPSYHVNSIR